MTPSEYARLVLADDQTHPALRALLQQQRLTTHVLHTAHQRMPTDPVWRMVYVDAALLIVLARVPALHDDDDARECIAILDRAIIIAGAGTDDTRRDHVVHDLIRRLQSAIPSRPPTTAILVSHAAPVPSPSTARNSTATRSALPSILASRADWCHAPFVVPGHAADWPAIRRWPSLAYLFSAAGPGRTVPIEVGADYRSDDWSPTLVRWEDFLASLDPSAHSHQTTYLAQYALLSQFPQLRDDVLLPDIVYAALDAPAYKPPADVIINAWLGPKGTVSPAHTDPFFNCYVQVVGRKTVWLAPPDVAPAMYPFQPRPCTPLMGNTSQVDVFHPSQSPFPLFWDTVPDRASCVTLRPGDLLFFPPGWWHAMRSEDASFSVSMWF